MKPEQWIIDDIRLLRAKNELTQDEKEYLELLLDYTKIIQGKKK